MSTVVEETLLSTAVGSPALEATFLTELAEAREPQWLVDLRSEAWARANREGAIAEQGITVDKKDERWRFSGHKGWTLGGALRVKK